MTLKFNFTLKVQLKFSNLKSSLEPSSFPKINFKTNRLKRTHTESQKGLYFTSPIGQNNQLYENYFHYHHQTFIIFLSKLHITFHVQSRRKNTMPKTTLRTPMLYHPKNPCFYWCSKNKDAKRSLGSYFIRHT